MRCLYPQTEVLCFVVAKQPEANLEELFDSLAFASWQEIVLDSDYTGLLAFWGCKPVLSRSAFNSWFNVCICLRGGDIVKLDGV